jgi:hypothetical protein
MKHTHSNRPNQVGIDQFAYEKEVGWVSLSDRHKIQKNC